MKELRREITAITACELERANEKFPLFHSMHEGAAVLCEEIDELEDEYKTLETMYHCLWYDVKHDMKESALHSARNIKDRAIAAACEAVQVAAMCDKFRMLLDKEGSEE